MQSDKPHLPTPKANRSGDGDVKAGPPVPVHGASAIIRRIGLVTFVGGLGGGLVFPILPALGLQLGIPTLLIGVILSANRVSRLAFDEPAGRLVDRLGGKGPLTAGMCLEAFGIACYSGALHFGHPAIWLLVGRLIFGVGSALLMVGAQAVVLGLSSRADRGRSTAVVRIALSMGMPGGLVLGGVIADLTSDETAFWVGAGLTLIGALIAWTLVPTVRRSGPEAGTPDADRKAETHPKTDLPERAVLVASSWFNMMIFFCVQGALLATLVIVVQDRGLHLFGLGAQGTAGLVMAVLMACSSAAAFVFGRRIDRIRLRSTVILPALVVLATGFAVLAFARHLPLILAGVVLIGGSFNGITLPMLALLGDVVDPDRYGRAVGVYQMFGDVGGSLGPVVGFEACVRLGILPTYLGLSVLVGLSCVAAIWLHRLERRKRIPAHGAA